MRSRVRSMARAGLAGGLLLMPACVDDNPAFLGPGFMDSVESGQVHPVWESTDDTWWQMGTCDPQADGDANWRAGMPQTCDQLGLGVLPSTGRLVLATRPVPAAGTVRLTMRSRVSLPQCQEFALIGARVGGAFDGTVRPFRLGDEQPLLGEETSFVLSGHTEWTTVESTLELGDEIGELVVSFGIELGMSICLDELAADGTCRLRDGAPASCAPVLSCCEASLANQPEPTGWQIDDIELTIEQ